jgi:uncharacterized protein YkwD
MACLACDEGATTPPPVMVTTMALGQPSGDYPSYDERVVLYASNRARMSPAAEGWPTYAAAPPLQWNLNLNQSSRAHSVDMRDTPCFQHPSCGSATDDTVARVQTYYTAAWRRLGENIAGGPADGVTVVHNWIFEIGATAGETGHRDNLFSPMFNLLGAGYAPGGMPRPAVTNFWTQDFVGTAAALTLPRMTDGIHLPSGAAGGGVTFGTTYYDAAGGGPTSIGVNVDGTCTPLLLATAAALPRGTAARGAYEATLTLAAGCHAYYFYATSASAELSYPDSGALQVAVGAASAGGCPLFVPTRAADSCGGGGAGGAGGGRGAGGERAAAGAAGTDGGMAMGAGGGAGNDSGSTLGGAGGKSAEEGGVNDGGPAGGAGPTSGMGCECRLSSTNLAPEDRLAPALIAGWLGLWVRGRRRRRAPRPR